MKKFEVAYMGNYLSIVYKVFMARDEAEARRKTERYCDNQILHITEITE
jgi:hypothetical protein